MDEYQCRVKADTKECLFYYFVHVKVQNKEKNQAIMTWENDDLGMANTGRGYRGLPGVLVKFYLFICGYASVFIIENSPTNILMVFCSILYACYVLIKTLLKKIEWKGISPTKSQELDD